MAANIEELTSHPQGISRSICEVNVWSISHEARRNLAQRVQWTILDGDRVTNLHTNHHVT